MAPLASLKTMMIATTVIWLLVVAESTPDTSVQSWACNTNTYSSGGRYSDNVIYVLAALMNVTPNHGYDYYTQSPSTDNIAYGHATCNSALSYNDCADCLTAVRASVNSICEDKIGGSVNMVDCTIRYENYSF